MIYLLNPAQKNWRPENIRQPAVVFLIRLCVFFAWDASWPKLFSRQYAARTEQLGCNNPLFVHLYIEALHRLLLSMKSYCFIIKTEDCRRAFIR